MLDSLRHCQFELCKESTFVYLFDCTHLESTYKWWSSWNTDAASGMYTELGIQTGVCVKC